MKAIEIIDLSRFYKIKNDRGEKKFPTVSLISYGVST